MCKHLWGRGLILHSSGSFDLVWYRCQKCPGTKVETKINQRGVLVFQDMVNTNYPWVRFYGDHEALFECKRCGARERLGSSQGDKPKKQAAVFRGKHSCCLRGKSIID